MAVGWWYGDGEEEVVEEGVGVRTPATAAAAALEKYEAVGGFPAGVRDWPAAAVREKGEWRANWVGEVRLMGEKLESDDPLGVGGERRAVYG